MFVVTLSCVRFFVAACNNELCLCYSIGDHMKYGIDIYCKMLYVIENRFEVSIFISTL